MPGTKRSPDDGRRPSQPRRAQPASAIAPNHALVDRLADLTGLRDRDVLDVTLVSAIRDLLRPVSVAIYRRVGEPGAGRWMTRARLGASDVVATADPAWAELDTLPLLDAYPARVEAMQREWVVHLPGAAAGDPCLCVFPLATEVDARGVLEIVTVAPLGVEAQRQVASVLRIYCNFQGLLDYSERDTLTGLLNRKTFDDAFLKATARAPASLDVATDLRRAGVPGGQHWLAVIDIDHFKRVNDQHGHLIGDEVLLLLARLMRGSFRHHDRLYRFGGEEFVALIRCGNAADAALAFERLRFNTERYAFPRIEHITISVGFTEVKLNDSPSGAFERADRAVYHAKGNGRNQVCSHAELVAAGTLTDTAIVGDVELF